MKKFAVISVFLFYAIFSSVFAVAQEAKSTALSNQKISDRFIEFYIQHQGVERKYIVYGPLLKKPIKLPVVIAFHGGGGNAEKSIQFYDLHKKAEKEKFLLVYPEGYGRILNSGSLGSWNAGRCCPPASKDNIDDVGFIREMIKKLNEDYKIDTKRIYLTGMSNGALMVYKLACELSDQIAAIAAVGGHDALDKCNPSRAVPTLHIHGTEDHCSSYNGGGCGGCGKDYMRAMLGLQKAKTMLWDCESVQAYFDIWSKIAKCNTKTNKFLLKDKVECQKYSGCANDAHMLFCSIDGMGHVWPGDTNYKIAACRKHLNGKHCRNWKEIVGPTSDAIDANDFIWAFFKQQKLN